MVPGLHGVTETIRQSSLNICVKIWNDNLSNAQFFIALAWQQTKPN